MASSAWRGQCSEWAWQVYFAFEVRFGQSSAAFVRVYYLSIFWESHITTTNSAQWNISKERFRIIFTFEFLSSATSHHLVFLGSKSMIARYHQYTDLQSEILKTQSLLNNLLALGIDDGSYTLSSPTTNSGMIIPEQATYHASIYQSPTNSLQAAFGSDDRLSRILDVLTERWKAPQEFNSLFNYTTIEPDGKACFLVLDR